jgi:hypothetical protein
MPTGGDCAPDVVTLSAHATGCQVSGKCRAGHPVAATSEAGRLTWYGVCPHVDDRGRICGRPAFARRPRGKVPDVPDTAQAPAPSKPGVKRVSYA